MSKSLKEERLGATNYNNQGCLMKIVEYNSIRNVIVEFQDKYKCQKKTQWDYFQKGSIDNPYHPSVCGVGMHGIKYPICVNGKKTKEYIAWKDMLYRSCSDKNKLPKSQIAYINVTCCKEWLLFENFYEWLHSQENFEVWKSNKGFALDKDILVKGNKVYSPETCCLVPERVNALFVRAYGKDKKTTGLPIGVKKDNSKYNCAKPYYATYWSKDVVSQNGSHHIFLGSAKTPEEAFQIYKQYKEAYIKQVTQEEYDKGTISKKCYEAMMRWEVEIND